MKKFHIYLYKVDGEVDRLPSDAHVIGYDIRHERLLCPLWVCLLLQRRQSCKIKINLHVCAVLSPHPVFGRTLVKLFGEHPVSEKSTECQVPFFHASLSVLNTTVKITCCGYL